MIYITFSMALLSLILTLEQREDIYNLRKSYNSFYKFSKYNLNSVYGKTVTDFYADTDSFKEK